MEIKAKLLNEFIYMKCARIMEAVVVLLPVGWLAESFIFSNNTGFHITAVTSVVGAALCGFREKHCSLICGNTLMVFELKLRDFPAHLRNFVIDKRSA